MYCTTDSTSYRHTARSRAHSSMTEKRRKATNTKRKEEIDGLKEEVRKLRRELKLQADQLDNARVQSALPPPWEHHPLCT
ncbi:uncharacterized protein IUM83_06541 [Phytophthora cinnamomi]|uniref:uncharacterized protein n=1 Tax=Phytophthora cinnamomi TaxID=4785 RepID=UPI00355A7056|nr:hypothetical protein IUM83_06541 [Phytophthora cinnamomi]